MPRSPGHQPDPGAGPAELLGGLGDQGVRRRAGHHLPGQPDQAVHGLLGRQPTVHLGHQARTPAAGQPGAQIGRVQLLVEQGAERQAQGRAACPGPEPHPGQHRPGRHRGEHRPGVGPGQGHPAAAAPDQIGAGVREHPGGRRARGRGHPHPQAGHGAGQRRGRRVLPVTRRPVHDPSLARAGLPGRRHRRLQRRGASDSFKTRARRQDQDGRHDFTSRHRAPPTSSSRPAAGSWTGGGSSGCSTDGRAG